MILHINGNYPYHSLHSELLSRLADLGEEHLVFIPLRGKKNNTNSYHLEKENVHYLCKSIISITDRLFFLKKVYKLFFTLKESFDMNKINCTIAYTLYSDGVVAYFLYKKYQIPYSIVIRNTDINVHMKYRPYLRPLIQKVIRNANSIVALSPHYKEKLAKKFSDQFRDKINIIPNAVNDFWFNLECEARMYHNPLKLIFVGEVNPNKNVYALIKITKQLNDSGINTNLDIVGEGSELSRCYKLAKRLNISEKIFFHGWQSSKEQLKNLYDEADIFVMLSHTETFGTVYIEAISQGIPIIYTQGQGIDGYFEEGIVGYSCIPTDIPGACKRIIDIMNNYSDISRNCLRISRQFCWDKVASAYNEVIEKTKHSSNS